MTQTETFPFGTIILVPDALRLILQQEILAQGSGQIGVTLLSLPAWLSRFKKSETPSRASQLLSCRQVLLAHRNDFPIFGSLFEDTAFLQECRSFLDELKREDVALDTMPQTQADERELHGILSLLAKLPSEADSEREALAALQAESDFSYIRIYPAFFRFEDQRIIQLLLERGAKMMERVRTC